MSGRENLRRSSRIKSLVKEAPKKYSYQASNDDDDKSVSDLSNVQTKEELENIEENIQKPIELFSDDDVSGQTLYAFETPGKKSTMTQKASLCRTPGNITKETPKILLPKVIVKKLDIKNINLNISDKSNQNSHKKAFTQRSYNTGLTSESESKSDSSNYSPTEDESDDNIESGHSDISNEDEEEDAQKGINFKSVKPKYIPERKVLGTPKRTDGKYKSKIIHKDYHLKADEYFATQSEKIITSDRTLERLHNSRLTKQKLDELLANQNSISARHKKEISSITENYESLFPMWHFIMEEGFTVLLHGLGSKRSLINDFHKMVMDHPSLIVNGFFPSLTIKDILEGIITDLLELSAPGSPSDCLDLIEKVMGENPADRLYLLIHNVEGVMLRTNKSQEVLSCLASIPNVCVLASVDHINAPLLWDHVKKSKYNFFWWDVTTFLPYQAETSYENSLLVQQSGTLALSSLQNVFLSLTSNAKAIYILLAKYQLSNTGNANYSGMAFKDLYRAAREGFLVSSDLALRAQLTEFIDHKLVKTKRNIDGVEHLIIPLNNRLLKQFVDERES